VQKVVADEDKDDVEWCSEPDEAISIWKVVYAGGIGVRTMSDRASARTGRVAPVNKRVVVVSVKKHKNNTYLLLHDCNDLGPGWLFAYDEDGSALMVDDTAGGISDDMNVPPEIAMAFAFDVDAMADERQTPAAHSATARRTRSRSPAAASVQSSAAATGKAEPGSEAEYEDAPPSDNLSGLWKPVRDGVLIYDLKESADGAIVSRLVSMIISMIVS